MLNTNSFHFKANDVQGTLVQGENCASENFIYMLTNSNLFSDTPEKS